MIGRRRITENMMQRDCRLILNAEFIDISYIQAHESLGMSVCLQSHVN